MKLQENATSTQGLKKSRIQTMHSTSKTKFGDAFTWHTQELTEFYERENYYEKFSQINMTKEEIKKKGFEPIRLLITKELEYVKKEL